MSRLAAGVAINCKTCSKAKYKRHPVKQTLGKTPIPSHAGELLHVDIFYTDKQHFLIARCLKIGILVDDTIYLILLATTAYNRTIHSVTNNKPVDVIYSTPIEIESEIKERIRETQDKTREQAIKTKAHREYQVGDKVC